MKQIAKPETVREAIEAQHRQLRTMVPGTVAYYEEQRRLDRLRSILASYKPAAYQLAA